jgi:5-methyltetrahydrofolate--homocysteine methyltransferase
VSVRSSLEELLEPGRVVLADGAAGTNYFGMGLEAGDAPELWNVDHPELVQELHRAFSSPDQPTVTRTRGGRSRPARA